MSEIPVIIVNWNGFDDTVECIESILNQSFQDFVIHLSDNNSDNNEFYHFTKIYGNNPKIILHKNDTNLGFTIAHNNILENLIEEGAEFVALLNNDAIADKNWLKNMLTVAKKNNSDIVASKMFNFYEPGIIDSKGLFFLSSGEILPAENGEKELMEKKNYKIVAASGGACLYRIDMLKEIGIFDTYFSTGYEDAELGLRAFIAGKIITFSENSVVYHKLSRSVRRVTDQKKTQKIQEDINYTYLKLMPLEVILLNSIFNFPRILIILLIHIITFRFRYLTAYLKAALRTITIDRQLITKMRIEYNKLRKISSVQIIKSQKFFLSHDIVRFYKFIIKGKMNKFEKY